VYVVKSNQYAEDGKPKIFLIGADQRYFMPKNSRARRDLYAAIAEKFSVYGYEIRPDSLELLSTYDNSNGVRYF